MKWSSYGWFAFMLTYFKRFMTGTGVAGRIMHRTRLLRGCNSKVGSIHFPPLSSCRVAGSCLVVLTNRKPYATYQCAYSRRLQGDRAAFVEIL